MVGSRLIGSEWELWEFACPMLTFMLTLGRVSSPCCGIRGLLGSRVLRLQAHGAAPGSRGCALKADW